MEEIPANQLRLVVYPILFRVLYIPGGAGFLPSTVAHEFVLCLYLILSDGNALECIEIH